MTNKQAKERLIELYGAECFIDKLQLRKDTGIEIKATDFEVPSKSKKFNRAKIKRETQKLIDEEFEI